MKKIKFTVNQINEVLNVSVDVQNNDVATSIQKAKTETDRTVGSGVERNYVISGDELNEDENSYSEDIFSKCINELLDDFENDPNLEDMYINAFGNYNINEVMDALAEYYTDLTGNILYNDMDAYNIMKKKFIEITNQKFYNESKKYTKKQIEESKTKKNFQVLTKKSIEESFKKLNELNSKTYIDAAKKAYNKHQFKRFNDLENYADNVFHNETGFVNGDNLFMLTYNGFVFEKQDDDKMMYQFTYNLDNDTICDENDEEIEPGDLEIRLNDRKLIKTILTYFAKYKPDSKYNNKDYWIS